MKCQISTTYLYKKCLSMSYIITMCQWRSHLLPSLWGYTKFRTWKIHGISRNSAKCFLIIQKEVRKIPPNFSQFRAEMQNRQTYKKQMEFCVDGIQCRRNSVEIAWNKSLKIFFSDYVQEKKIHPPSVVLFIDFGTNAKYWRETLSEKIHPTTGSINMTK